MARLGITAILLLVACAGRAPAPAAPEPSPDDTGSETEATPVAEPAPPRARVRLIHAAVESSTQPVSLSADASDTTTPTSYEFSSTYLTLTPGDHALSARANDTELIGASFTFGAGLSTIIAYSTGDFPVALSHLSDSDEPAPADTAQLRFFHALVGQAAFDICVPPATARGDGTPIVANLTPGTPPDAYISVPGGVELVMQLRAHHATPCHGRPFGIARGFLPASASNYTLVFVGRTGRRSVPSELLFCADPPASDTSCATIAIEAH